MSNDLVRAASILAQFSGISLTRTLSSIERAVEGADGAACTAIALERAIGADVIAAAGSLKRVAGQINVAIHAVGIILSLPHLLEAGERIERVSLGAGNTGRAFDLETNRRIAEFKFITWQGGPEAVRQNSLFKDYYLLAEHETTKRRYLYVLDTTYPLKFLTGNRAMTSVLSRNVKLRSDFMNKYGASLRTVRDYYNIKKGTVLLEDVSKWVPTLLTGDHPE